MVSRAIVEAQLKRIGCNFRFWGRGEISELGNLLMANETIAQAVNGHYAGGFAMLCVTDQRLLLIDHKPLAYLTIEDMRFDMITEFDYSHRLFDATVHIFTPNKALTFTSWNQPRLNKLLKYVQQRVIEIRQHYYMAQQFEAMAASQYTHQSQASNRPYVPSYASQAPPQVSAPNGGTPQQSTAFAALRPKLGSYTYSKIRRRVWPHNDQTTPAVQQQPTLSTYDQPYEPGA